MGVKFDMVLISLQELPYFMGQLDDVLQKLKGTELKGTSTDMVHEDILQIMRRLHARTGIPFVLLMTEDGISKRDYQLYVHNGREWKWRTYPLSNEPNLLDLPQMLDGEWMEVVQTYQHSLS